MLGKQNVSSQTIYVEIAIGRGNDKCEINIGGQELSVCIFSTSHARELGMSRQDFLDNRRGSVGAIFEKGIHNAPISNRGKIRAETGCMQHFAGKINVQQLPIKRQTLINISMLCGNANSRLFGVGKPMVPSRGPPQYILIHVKLLREFNR